MTNQISKIQLRRGLQAELPGATSAGLDVGEVAFTTDTNRLFIGADTSPFGTSALVSRVHGAQTEAGFPFSNVEILTEFSPANRVVFDTEARNITSAFLVSTVMAVGAPPQPVMVLQTASFSSPPAPLPFVFDAQSPTGLFGTAQISYHILDQANGNIPLRAGRLTLFHQGNAFPPSLSDDAVCNPYAGTPTGGQPIDPNDRYGMISFQPAATANGIQLQYQITVSGANPPQPVMYFRIEQPVPQHGLVSGPPMGNAGASTIFNIQASAPLPYDIVGDLLDTLTDGETLFRLVFVRSVLFTAGLPGSRATCTIPATEPVNLTLIHNDDVVGSIDFAANATNATFDFPANVTVVPGDVMTLTGPSPADASLALISYTLSGSIAPL